MSNKKEENARRQGTMLQPYRVLDVAGDSGFVCGKILADLGADVIKIEKLGGDRARAIGPFYKDIVDPEKSLYWFAYNTNKRGITLNIETADGREIFKKLVKTVDFVVESFPPGYMDSVGLGYSELSRINPKIILTSISPFGQVGPYKDYAASDIVIQAMCGLLSDTGDPDRPPVQIGYPQAFLYAGLEAAVGALIALNYRQATGEGQHVDVSMQRSMLITTFDSLFWWVSNRVIKKRQGSTWVRPGTGVKARTIWQCKDGYITFFFFGSQLQARANKRFVEWMDSEGCASDYLKQIEWQKLDWSKLTQDDVNELEKPAHEFFMRHTKKELFEKALYMDMMLNPLYTMEDLLGDEQLSARRYWMDVEHDELGTAITYPGAWITATETPLQMLHRAPAIGEHNWEIYGRELGFSRQEIINLKGNGVI